MVSNRQITCFSCDVIVTSYAHMYMVSFFWAVSFAINYSFVTVIKREDFLIFSPPYSNPQVSRGLKYPEERNVKKHTAKQHSTQPVKQVTFLVSLDKTFDLVLEDNSSSTSGVATPLAADSLTFSTVARSVGSEVNTVVWAVSSRCRKSGQLVRGRQVEDVCVAIDRYMWTV